MFSRIIKPNWHPSHLTHMHIYLEFLATLSHLGFGPSLPDVRTPEQNQALAHGHNPFSWHRDGDGGKLPIGVVVWSNVAPTRVRDIEMRTELITAPFDIVLIYNQVAEHAMPERVQHERGRWLARSFYYTKEDMGVWMPITKRDQ